MDEKIEGCLKGLTVATVCSDAFVFFGATGDLAYKKIFPALQAMIRRGATLRFSPAWIVLKRHGALWTRSWKA